MGRETRRLRSRRPVSRSEFAEPSRRSERKKNCKLKKKKRTAQRDCAISAFVPRTTIIITRRRRLRRGLADTTRVLRRPVARCCCGAFLCGVRLCVLPFARARPPHICARDALVSTTNPCHTAFKARDKTLVRVLRGFA